jgi:glycosyltransferase involved in cell wall biosynthesis
MKFAFITPRYGADIGGGPEHVCRLFAEQVSGRHHVDVLTTCARDPRTWRNEDLEGADRMRGVLVRRFAVNQEHDRTAFRQLSTRLFGMPQGREDEHEWVRRLGPTSPALIEYLKRQHRSYDALVFFSLYHPTTVFGLAIAPERSVLFPCLRLDPALRFGIWSELLGSVKAIGYLSGAERHQTHRFFRLPTPDEVVGLGIEPPAQQTYPRHQQDPADEMLEAEHHQHEASHEAEVSEYLAGRGVPFRRRHRLYGSFVLYAGRVQPNNGCEELLEYFDAYASGNRGTALVLMGAKLMKVPEQPHFRMGGVLPERERMIAYEAADLTVAPEPDDPAAIAALESFAVGTPVLASARSAAAADYCRRANAGLYYATRDEFIEALRLLMNDARLRARLGENGRRYIRLNHRWDAVLGRFERLMMRVRRP